MNQSVVSTQLENGILTITIDRQDKLNALNSDVFTGLEQAFGTQAVSDEVRAIVLTGAGDRAFVAGADIEEITTLDPEDVGEFTRRGHRLMAGMEALGKPVIAAINGYALGGGCELALACTLRIAADTALIGLPEVKLGLVPGYGGTQRMTRLAGRSRALQLMLTGDPISAEQALNYGIVNQVVPAQELGETVSQLAKKLARSAPLAMDAIIRTVNQGADLTLEQGIALETEAFVALAKSEDMREGTSAFLEKRKAEFKGR